MVKEEIFTPRDDKLVWESYQYRMQGYRRGVMETEARYAKLVKLATDLKAYRFSRSAQSLQQGDGLMELLNELADALAELERGW